MSDEADLYALEEGFWTGGPEAFEQHCDARCLAVFAEMADLMTRAAIARTATPGRWTGLDMEPIGFVRLSADAALIAYEARARRADGRPYRARVSSAYVRRADGWKLAAHQQTPLPAG